MRTISLWLFLFTLTASLACAQDDTAQRQIDKLSGSIQDLATALDTQNKKIAALEKDVSDLRDQLNKPGANASVSPDDLRKLAEQVQEIDKKRQDDRELILKEIEKLGKTGATSTSGPRSKPNVAATPTAGGSGGKEQGYEYTIQKDDTLNAIAKAYRDQGIKVTVDQIVKANPGLNPKSLIVGKKIFIPAPAQ